MQREKHTNGENFESKSRLAYIDVMRGIGILLVCLGHSIGALDNPINRAILSFHMPLFFFISGILFFGRTFEREKISEYGKKKFRVLLVPQFLQGTLSVIWRIGFYSLLFVLKGEKIILKNIINLDFLGWFLIVLFLMDIIMFLELKYFNKDKTKYIILICTLVLFFVIRVLKEKIIGERTVEIELFLWKTLEQLFCALFFGHLGMLCKMMIDKYLQCEKIHGICLLVFCVVAILSYFNQPIGMYVNDYGNKVMFLLTAMIGIFATLDLSCCLRNSKKLAWIGRNSIIIFVTHFQILDTMKLGMKALTSLPYDTYPIYIFNFLVLMLVEIPLIIIVNKYVPFLFGKSKVSKKEEIKS